jgi:hypothetical protein
MTYADGTTNYTNDTWVNKAVYMYGGISGSTDAGGILKYQISADNVNWVDYYYDYTNSMYGLTTSGIYYRYARAVDKSGNVSASISRTIKIDVTVPAVGINPSSISTGATTTSVVINAIDGSGSGIYKWRYRLSSDGGSTYGNWQGVSTGYDPTKTYTLTGGVSVPVINGSLMNLTVNGNYLLEWDYRCASGAITYQVDLYPDTLPEVWVGATTTNQHYVWNNVTSSSSDMSASYWRFFSGYVVPNPADIYISNINMYPKGQHSITINGSGNWVIQVEATDNAGNVSITTSGLYKLAEQTVLNFDTNAEITNNFNFAIATSDTPSYASVVSDAGTAKFSTTALDRRYILQMKPITNGINNIEFSMGIWPSTYDFLTNAFGITFNDNSTIIFYVKHVSTYPGNNQYLPASTSYTNNFAVKNNIDGSAANLGAPVPDGYVTYTVSINASNVLTMTASTGQTYSYNVGSRKIISIALDPMYQWNNTATVGRIDYLKYLIN